jgi:ABC-type phosphate transport system substrate-binding protein
MKSIRLRTRAAGIAAATALLAMATVAQAEARHQSYMAHPYCLSVPGVPGDCTGFVVGQGRTVQMNCWEGGPQAFGQGKWFQITVMGTGSGYGAPGDVPAPAVGGQWMSAPHCG